MPEPRKPVKLMLLWHFHQPEYADPVTGTPALPWTRLHALKDYRDMVEILDRYPGVRITINVVPSLLDRLRSFSDGTARPDPFLEVARKPAAKLTAAERRFIVTYFLAFKRDTLARNLPRIHDLAVTRGEYGAEVKIFICQ